MLIVEQMSNVDKVRRFVKELLPYHVLPGFPISKAENKWIVVGMRHCDSPVGVAYGKIEEVTGIFFIAYVYVEKQFRIQQNVVHILESLLETYAEASDTKKAVWIYKVRADSMDFHQNILSQTSLCRLYNFTDSKMYRIKMSDICRVKYFNRFASQNLESMGYSPVKWRECDNKLKEKLSVKEKGYIGKEGYLSPFVSDENDWGIDGDASIILVRVENCDPIGWVICKQLPEKGVELIRFFIYKYERKGFLGLLFLSHVLKSITSLFDYISFEVGIKNRQMTRFLSAFDRYDGTILHSTGIKRYLELNLSKHKQ